MENLEEIEVIIKMAQKSNNLELLGKALHNKGNYLRDQGLQANNEQLLSDARNVFFEAAETLLKSEESELATNSLVNAAIIAQELGEYQEDFALLSEAVEEFQALADRKDIDEFTQVSIINTFGNTLYARAPLHKEVEGWSKDILLAINAFEWSVKSFANLGIEDGLGFARRSLIDAHLRMAELMALEGISHIEGHNANFYIQKAKEEAKAL